MLVSSGIELISFIVSWSVLTGLGLPLEIDWDLDFYLLVWAWDLWWDFFSFFFFFVTFGWWDLEISGLFEGLEVFLDLMGLLLDFLDGCGGPFFF